jgi:fused signal recognition particle receptor
MIQTLFGSLKENREPEEKRGLFDRMKQAVTRTRETLGSAIGIARPLDEEALENLEAALLSADIGVTTTSELLDAVRQRARDEQFRGGDDLRALLSTELKRVLNDVPQTRPATIDGPEVIMLVGVNGSGKTTTAGKLALLLKRQGKNVLLCAADTFRAAAIEQLEIWSQRAGIDMIKTKTGGDPSAALYDALEAAKARKMDVVIVDTAGRLHTKGNLMAELDKMRRTAQRLVPGAPHHTLLIIDAVTGQNGLQQAKQFTESAGVTGIALTKLDGTAKGGIVVAIARELELPVMYAGVGEKVEDLIPFDSDAFVDSLLAS